MDLDLSGILDVFLDLLRHIARDDLHSNVVNLFGLDHYAELAACLNCISLFDTVEFLCDLLELFKTLGVVLEILAACAGTCGGDSVRCLNENCNDSLGLDVVVVRLDGVNDLEKMNK